MDELSSKAFRASFRVMICVYISLLTPLIELFTVDDSYWVSAEAVLKEVGRKKHDKGDWSSGMIPV